MTNNSSVFVATPLDRQINGRVIFVQILFPVLLCMNLLLIITYFMKEIFYTNMRYILFANALFSDSINLILSNVLLLFVYLAAPIPTWSCLICFILSSLYNYVTPLTLTAMSLECYVAICKPLHHAQLCTTGRALQGILIIHILGSIPGLLELIMLFSSFPFSFFKQCLICSRDIFILYTWQAHVNSATSQFYFFIMCILIAFSYIKIMKVAKAASGKNKESTRKGLRTVILHAFQLLLCLIQLWIPFIEPAMVKIDFFVNVRYYNYICFNLAPKCLSPLIYGLRDEAFLLALKQWLFCCLFRKKLKC